MSNALFSNEAPRSASHPSRSSRSASSLPRVGATFVFLVLSLGAATAHADGGTDSGATDGAVDGGASVANETTRGSARSVLDEAIAEDKAGRSVFALHSAREALELSWSERDAATEHAAREAIALFRTHCGKVWFVIPKDAKDLDLTFDARPVVDARAGKSYYVDAGEHLVAAQAMVAGERHVFEEKVTIRAGENKLVDVALTKAELMCSICEGSPCMNDAKTESDVERCLKARRGCGGCAVTNDRSPSLAFVAIPLLALVLRRTRRRERARTT